MQAVRSLEPAIPYRDRLSTRLALVFIGTFLALLILSMAWTMFDTIADRRKASADSDIAAPVIVIDPKIQTELAKALAFDALPASGEVLNPFVDRANLSGSVLATNARPATQTGSSASSGSSVSGGTANARFGPGQRTISNIGQSPSMEVYSLKARHDDWLASQKRGEFVGPEAEVLAIEDLVPVGFASGGDRGAEVMLFSVSLCQTFSFPVGTRFFNGWLNGFDEREVVFTNQDGIRRKSYSNTEPCQPGRDSQLAN